MSKIPHAWAFAMYAVALHGWMSSGESVAVCVPSRFDCLRSGGDNEVALTGPPENILLDIATVRRKTRAVVSVGVFLWKNTSATQLFILALEFTHIPGTSFLSSLKPALTKEDMYRHLRISGKKTKSHYCVRFDQKDESPNPRIGGKFLNVKYLVKFRFYKIGVHVNS